MQTVGFLKATSGIPSDSPSMHWSFLTTSRKLDFGALTLNGCRIWALTIVDNFSRVSPAIWVGQQARATDVVDTLNRATAEFGCPGRIRVDNGSKFTSKELDLWAYANGVILDFSRPGKSTDNAFIEAFNSRFRWECLNQHWFLDLQDATMKNQCLAAGLQSGSVPWCHRQSGADGFAEADPSTMADGS